jgi:hypothetical protein
MEVLVEIARHQYDYIGDYIETVKMYTHQAATLEDKPRVNAQGIEFWTTLAEVEKMRLKQGQSIGGYIQMYLTDNLELILKCL